VLPRTGDVDLSVRSIDEAVTKGLVGHRQALRSTRRQSTGLLADSNAA
jgi:hypothetical protein